jgi:hypothetical protein
MYLNAFKSKQRTVGRLRRIQVFIIHVFKSKSPNREKSARVKMANMAAFCVGERERAASARAKPDSGTGFDLLLLKGDLC